MSKLGKWELWLRGLGKITARSGCVVVCPNQGPQWPTWAGPCFSLRLTLSLQRAVSLWVLEKDHCSWEPWEHELQSHFSARPLYDLCLLPLHKSVQHASFSCLGVVFLCDVPLPLAVEASMNLEGKRFIFSGFCHLGDVLSPNVFSVTVFWGPTCEGHDQGHTVS